MGDSMEKRKENRHILDQAWISFEEDTMVEAEYMALLEHVSNCTYCAEKFAITIEHSFSMENRLSMEKQYNQIVPPPYLKEEIRERTKQFNQNAATYIKEISRRMKLILYSLKVGFVVAVAIFILSITSNFEKIEFSQVEATRSFAESMMDKLNSKTNVLTSKMGEVSNYVIQGGK
ncbi:hypothetical protein LQZ18_12390 [Lachnospiraceae bacterium ZAX-1]